ncbi:Uncharacterised protein [Actinomyces howellii]|uniref:Uncharacterized protein n=1 Tax=Actinomyces howellii TaxID=52771 RepID=A0A448HHT1_9ACTO|nr:Uncharacterised protein [Actinomyces howellii]
MAMNGIVNSAASHEPRSDCPAHKHAAYVLPTTASPTAAQAICRHDMPIMTFD